MAGAAEIGKGIVELCNAGKFDEAVAEYYSSEIESVEAMAGPTGQRIQTGLDAIKKKGEWWEANHDVHRFEAFGPFPNGDDNQFCVFYKLDVTIKATGDRIPMEEVGLYSVAGGKIIREEFFYKT